MTELPVRFAGTVVAWESRIQREQYGSPSHPILTPKPTPNYPNRPATGTQTSPHPAGCQLLPRTCATDMMPRPVAGSAPNDDSTHSPALGPLATATIVKAARGELPVSRTTGHVSAGWWPTVRFSFGLAAFDSSSPDDVPASATKRQASLGALVAFCVRG